MANDNSQKGLLLRNNITQIIQIQLTRLKMCTYSNKRTKSYKCQLCKYSSKFKSKVDRHLLFHTEEKPFSCTLCNFKGSQHGSLNAHIRKHTGEKPWNCAFCQKLFTGSNYKTAHEKTCKLNPRKCDPTWVEMQKTTKCQLCPYSTARKGDLKKHVMTHTGEKPFPCKLCNKKFSLRGNLGMHISTHTREKPQNCQFCTKGFAQVGTQKNHEKTCKLNPKQGDAKWVEEQKKFKCQLCKYRTITKQSLETHVRSHTGEKPFKCPLCLYKCSQKSNLRRHLRKMHTKT